MLSLHVVAEPTMTYRDINLGDGRERVLAQARKEFEVVNLQERLHTYEALRIYAGDKEGICENQCRFGTPAERQKVCLSTRLNFTLKKEGEFMHSIMVEQSFSLPVALGTVSRVSQR